MRCPACAAENTQGPLCRRCRADLSLLFALEEQRREALGAARRHLLAGDGTAALSLAQYAQRLRSDVESWQVLALAHLMRRDFAAAWHCAQNARGERD